MPARPTRPTSTRTRSKQPAAFAASGPRIRSWQSCGSRGEINLRQANVQSVARRLVPRRDQNEWRASLRATGTKIALLGFLPTKLIERNEEVIHAIRTLPYPEAARATRDRSARNYLRAPRCAGSPRGRRGRSEE